MNVQHCLTISTRVGQISAGHTPLPLKVPKAESVLDTPNVLYPKQKLQTTKKNENLCFFLKISYSFVWIQHCEKTKLNVIPNLDSEKNKFLKYTSFETGHFLRQLKPVSIYIET